jgi:hypothetical protein
MHTGQEIQPVTPHKLGVNYETEDGVVFAVIPPYARVYKDERHVSQVILLDGTITTLAWRPDRTRERPGLLGRLWEAVFGRHFVPLVPPKPTNATLKVEVQP